MREVILFAFAFLVWGVLMLRAKSALSARGFVSMIAAVFLTVLFSRSWVEVPPGQVGTVYDPFGGGIHCRSLAEAPHLVASSIAPLFPPTSAALAISVAPDRAMYAPDTARHDRLQS